MTITLTLFLLAVTIILSAWLYEVSRRLKLLEHAVTQLLNALNPHH